MWNDWIDWNAVTIQFDSMPEKMLPANDDNANKYLILLSHNVWNKKKELFFFGNRLAILPEGNQIRNESPIHFGDRHLSLLN